MNQRSNPTNTPAILILTRICILLALSCLSVQAGNGPQNYLVVYDPSSANNIAVAHYYKELRGIPESNLFAYEFPKHRDGSGILRKITSDQAYEFILALREYVADAGLNRIHGIALAGETPLNVDEGSITAALGYAPNATSGDDLKEAVGKPENHLFGQEFYVYNIDSTEEIRSDKVYNGASYWLAAHVGYPGARGLRMGEIFDLLERSAVADETKEEGTVYWPTNGNVRSNTREPQIPDTTAEWDSLGISYHVVDGTQIVENKNLPPGDPDIANRAIQGVVGGFPYGPNIQSANNRYTRGAITEHLTSFAGVMGWELFNEWAQTTVSAWLRAGAYGSAGMVSEPFAIASKFPHSKVHSHYFRGATLAEAFMLSIQHPKQMLVVGDPLCQPYATLPKVAISGINDGATISGIQTIAVAVTGDVEATHDLFVDGRWVAESAGNFSLDTTSLSDGYHELRVVAYGNTPVRSQGSAVRKVRVNNTGGTVTVTSDTSVDYRSSFNVTADLNGFADVDHVKIVASGLTLAELPASGGTASIPSDRLSFKGVNKVFAVAVKTDGEEIWSMPQDVTVNWSELPAQSVDLTSALARTYLWEDATVPGFDWTNPDQTQLVVDREGLVFQNTDDGVGNLKIDFPLVDASMLGRAAVEFKTYLIAEETDFYDFAVQRNCGLELWVGGRKLIDVPDPDDNPTELDHRGRGDITYAMERLSAGIHEVRVRVPRIQSQSGFRMGVRSANTRLSPGGRTTPDFVDFIPLGRADSARASAENVVSQGNTPPLMFFVSPAFEITGGLYSQIEAEVNPTHTIEAAATDEDGIDRVAFYIDGDFVGEDTDAPFTSEVIEQSTPSGTVFAEGWGEVVPFNRKIKNPRYDDYEIRATAVDRMGNAASIDRIVGVDSELVKGVDVRKPEPISETQAKVEITNTLPYNVTVKTVIHSAHNLTAAHPEQGNYEIGVPKWTVIPGGSTETILIYEVERITFLWDWDWEWVVARTNLLMTPPSDTAHVYRLPFNGSFTPSSSFKNWNPDTPLTESYDLSIDWSMPEGTPILAARSGQILAVKEDSDDNGPVAAANFVEIQHQDGTIARYSHLRFNGVTVTEGQVVQEGELIGFSGNTGFSSHPHLQFYVYYPTLEGDQRVHRRMPVRFFSASGDSYFPRPGVTDTAIERAELPEPEGAKIQLSDTSVSLDRRVPRGTTSFLWRSFDLESWTKIRTYLGDGERVSFSKALENLDQDRAFYKWEDQHEQFSDFPEP